MIIKQLHIDSFGAVRDLDFAPEDGLNVIYGDNEAGKTSLAYFIKFIFYGLSGKSIGGRLSERARFVNWDTGAAGGWAVVSMNDGDYRIERCLRVSGSEGKESYREAVSVTELATGATKRGVSDVGGIFFGVPEQIFVNTVFTGTSGGSRIDGDVTAAAIENLMFSADENVSVKKAADKLDSIRKSLLHKVGSGGELYRLEDEIAELRGRLDASRSAAAQIIDIETAVATGKNSEAAFEERIGKAERLLEFYDSECLVRAAQEADIAASAARKLDAEAKEKEDACVPEEKVQLARDILSAMSGTGSKINELNDRYTELEAGATAAAGDGTADPEGNLARYYGSKKHEKTLKLLGIIAFAVALCTAGAAIWLYAVKSPLYLVLGGAAALFIIAGALSLVFAGRAGNTAAAVLELYDVETAEELEAATAYEREKLDEGEELRRRAAAVRLNADDVQKERAVLITRGEVLAAEIFPDVADDADAAEKIEGALRHAAKLREEAQTARVIAVDAASKAKVLGDAIDKEALVRAIELTESAPGLKGTLDREGAEKMRRSLKFDRSALDATRQKTRTAEAELAGRKATFRSPAELNETIARKTAELEEARFRYDAVTLAQRALAEAGENMRRGILPKITEKASALFTESTDGRYESLAAEGSFALNAVEDGHTRDGRALSSGTEDLAYVCLRVALASVIFGKEKAPLIFDESFAFIDPGRRAAIHRALAASGHQSLVFTCREEDEEKASFRMKRR